MDEFVEKVKQRMAGITGELQFHRLYWTLSDDPDEEKMYMKNLCDQLAVFEYALMLVENELALSEISAHLEQLKLTSDREGVTYAINQCLEFERGVRNG